MKKYELVQAYGLLANSKMPSLSAEEKYKVINVAKELKKVADDYQSFVEEAKKKAKDDKELNEIASMEATKEYEVEIGKLGDLFDKLMKDNDWTIGQAIILEGLLK